MKLGIFLKSHQEIVHFSVNYWSLYMRKTKFNIKQSHKTVMMKTCVAMDRRTQCVIITGTPRLLWYNF